MSIVSKVDMSEVTRLTRAGRLAEAMALIQGRSAEVSAPAPAGAGEAGSGESAGGFPPALDFTAPSMPGGAWTVPERSAPSFPRLKADPSPGQRPGAPAPRDWLAALAPKAGALHGRNRPRPAPVPVPDGARFEERSFSNASGGRAYKIYVPSRYTGQALPVVAMLHGCTQDPDDFAAGTRMNELAEEQVFLVVYPQQKQSANMQKCWNWFNAADQQRGSGEPSLIAGIVQEVVREFSADPSRIYVAGLSAGGAAAAVMAATYPDLFAAVGVHSGLACGAAADMPSAFAAMAGQGVRCGSGDGSRLPTIIFHGDADRTVNPVNADDIAARVAPAKGLETTVIRGETAAGMPYSRMVQTDGEGRAFVEQWTLHGAGHAWSGGSWRGSYTEPRGPDASREMMRFFLPHRNPSAALNRNCGGREVSEASEGSTMVE